MVWQPYWIEQKYYEIFSLDQRETSSISVKLHNYDLVFMGNIGFKFQPDQAHGLAARII